jgi:hypothetical protein
LFSAATSTAVSCLTLTCVYADHNLIFFKYFAADESQSLAAIFRNEEGAIDGASILIGGEPVPAFQLTVILQLWRPNLERPGSRSLHTSARTLA